MILVLTPSSNILSVLLGLLAAATWGAADFAGGLATRRAAPSLVVFIAHGTSLLLLAAASLAMPASLSPWATLGGLLSGVAGGAALMVFYEALSLGAMGLSAAIAGLLTAVLPVILAIRTQGLPTSLQIAGFAVAAAAIVLIAYAPPAPGFPSKTASARRALLLATLAGAGFGLQLVWLHASAAAGAPTHGSSRFAPVVRALLLSRVGGTAIALLAQALSRTRHRLQRPPSVAAPLPFPRLSLPVLAALAGLLDTSGNGLYMLSSLSGRLDVAAVLSSLYPGATIVLAAVFLREHATRLQALGMGLALVAVALIAA